MDFFSILTLIGGLALFLYGMDVMGDGLKKLSGSKLEYFLGKLTSNRFKGFLLGFAVTAVIQSSSATTVMLVGFVNSGIMKLSQTISIIMGANIGTTVTSWLLSLSGISGESFFIRLLKPSSFTPILAAVGIIMSMTAKYDKTKDIASIMIGFAVLMFGMETMSGAMSSLKDDPKFAHIMVMFSNPIMGILSGLILTAIIQSSSASVGILQALSLTGAISYSTAIPIILGQNIGTTVTPIISSINGNRESKRVAITCLNIKIIGVVIVSVVFYMLNAFIGFSFMQNNVSALNIAIIHTLFNIISTVILFPFCGAIEKLSCMMIKGESNPEDDEPDKLSTLDDRFLTMPSFAAEKCRELTYEMARLAQKAVTKSSGLLSDYDKNIDERIAKYESKVDKYEDKLSAYLVALAANKLNTADSHKVTKLLHIIGDVERISDHAVNISETAREISSKKIKFSDDAAKEIKTLTNAVLEILDITTRMLEHDNLELAHSVEPLEQIIDKLRHVIKNNHIMRLQNGECTVEMGFILSDLLTNYERIADHCSNIAVSVLGNANNEFESHDYLAHIKNDGEHEFFEKYNFYKQKYRL